MQVQGPQAEHGAETRLWSMGKTPGFGHWDRVSHMPFRESRVATNGSSRSQGKLAKHDLNIPAIG
jgi:hypothetical protein